MKYRNKVAVVEAIQFDPAVEPWPWGIVPAPCYCRDIAQDGHICTQHGAHRTFVVQAFDARFPDDRFPEKRRINKGDWLIKRGSDFVVMTDKMFQQTYEPVPECMMLKLLEELDRIGRLNDGQAFALDIQPSAEKWAIPRKLAKTPIKVVWRVDVTEAEEGHGFAGGCGDTLDEAIQQVLDELEDACKTWSMKYAEEAPANADA